MFVLNADFGVLYFPSSVSMLLLLY